MKFGRGGRGVWCRDMVVIRVEIGFVFMVFGLVIIMIDDEY